MLNKWNNKKEKMGELQYARNKYGSFKVATHYETGEWSKHREVLECWENENRYALETANNRNLFECEVVLDLDPEKNESWEETKERAKITFKQLKKLKFQLECYFSGSRGYHFH